MKKQRIYAFILTLVILIEATLFAGMTPIFALYNEDEDVMLINDTIVLSGDDTTFPLQRPKIGNVMVSAGYNHTVGLKIDGTVIVVGDNTYRQCKTADWNNIVSVTAGKSHTIGLKNDGTVIAIGDNTFGQCNINDWSDIVAVSAGDDCTFGLKSDGTVLTTYNYDYGQCADWSNIIAISAGKQHIVGLKSDGTVVAVGSNIYTDTSYWQYYTGQCDTSDWTDIIAIAAGGYHTVGIKSDGTVISIGYNGYGQCNTSDWVGIKAIAAGVQHTVGVKSDGTVIAIGPGWYGACNTADWNNIVSVSASENHTLGLKSDGTVRAIGRNYEGQCNVSSWINVNSVAAGYSHTIGLKNDGTVIAAGTGDIGHCNTTDWSNIVSVAVGWSHTVGLKNDGTVLATGDNRSGECNTSDWCAIIAISAERSNTVGLKSDGTVLAIGDNTYGQCNTSGWSNIIAIAAGGNHIVGLRSDGTVVTVGDNTYGQCNTSNWNNIVAVAASGYTTVGLKNDGTVIAISTLAYGQCNTSDWTDIVAITTGNEYTVGLKSDGTVIVAGWWNNFWLQYRTMEDWNGINSVNAGYRYSIGVKNDGTVLSAIAEGNDYGQGNLYNWSLKVSKVRMDLSELNTDTIVYQVLNGIGSYNIVNSIANSNISLYLDNEYFISQTSHWWNQWAYTNLSIDLSKTMQIMEYGNEKLQEFYDGFYYDLFTPVYSNIFIQDCTKIIFTLLKNYTFLAGDVKTLLGTDVDVLSLTEDQLLIYISKVPVDLLEVFLTNNINIIEGISAINDCVSTVTDVIKSLKGIGIADNILDATVNSLKGIFDVNEISGGIGLTCDVIGGLCDLVEMGNTLNSGKASFDQLNGYIDISLDGCTSSVFENTKKSWTDIKSSYNNIGGTIAFEGVSSGYEWFINKLADGMMASANPLICAYNAAIGIGSLFLKNGAANSVLFSKYCVGHDLLYAANETYNENYVRLIYVTKGLEKVTDEEFEEIQNNLRASVALIYIIRSQLMSYERELTTAFFPNDSDVVVLPLSSVETSENLGLSFLEYNNVTLSSLEIIESEETTITNDDNHTLTYQVSNGNATITGYTGTPVNVVIPSTLGGNTVTNIGDEAFKSCNSLENISIPNSVTSIGRFAFSGCINLTRVELPDNLSNINVQAFSGCKSITSIKIPDSVESIDVAAFSGCIGLTGITIPNNVTSIGDWAFAGCKSLSSIFIPKNVTSIGNNVFAGTINTDTMISTYCDNLTYINVASDNAFYSSQDGILYNKNKTFLLYYPNGKTATSFAVLNGVQSIAENAFRSCNSLTGISLPSSVETIYKYAFGDCKNLNTIIINNPIVGFGNYLFSIWDKYSEYYKVTIYGVKGSSVQTYADSNNILFKDIIDAYLSTATAAVSTAEGTPTQTNVITAQTLVTALPSGDAKTALQGRIDTVQDIINSAAVVAINAADIAGMRTAITTNAKTLGLDLTDFFTLTTKTPVYNDLVGKAFTNKADVKTAFDTAVEIQKAAESSAAADITPPVVSGEFISISGLTQTCVTLSWEKASDNASIQENLSYLVYRSDSDNIDSVHDAEINGTALGQYATDICTLYITGLNPGNTYYFNVIVMDEGGNKTAYSMQEVTIAAVYTVTYDANGGAGDAPEKSDKAEDETFTAVDNTFTAPDGKRFKEWNTESDGTGTGYPEGAAIIMPADNLTLYAVWEEIESVIIKFNFQGVAIKLIEPWGLRFYTPVSGSDFTSGLSFGTIVLHQDYYTPGMTAEEMMADPNAIILTSESGDSVLDSSSRIVGTVVGGIYTYTLNTSFYSAYVVINGEYIFSPVNSRNIYDRVVYLKDNSSDNYVKAIYQGMYDLYTDVKSYHDSLGTVTIPEPETIKRGSECSPGTVAANSGLVSYSFKGVAIRLIEPWGLCFYTEMTTADMNSITEFGTVVLSEDDYVIGMTGEEMRLSDNSYVFNSIDGTAVYDSSNRIVAKLVDSIYTYNMDKIFYTVSYAVIGGEYYYSGVNSRNMYDRVTLLKDTSSNVYVKEIYASMYSLYGAVDVYHRSLGLK